MKEADPQSDVCFLVKSLCAYPDILYHNADKR